MISAWIWLPGSGECPDSSMSPAGRDLLALGQLWEGGREGAGPGPAGLCSALGHSSGRGREPVPGSDAAHGGSVREQGGEMPGLRDGSGSAHWVCSNQLCLSCSVPAHLPRPAEERGAALPESLGDHPQPVTRTGLSSAGSVTWGEGHNRV